MRWGLVFSVPAAYESDLWGLPPPSKERRLSCLGGKQIVEYSYIFEYSPQSWNEWQRVAGIKVQLEHRIGKISFKDYEQTEVSGPVYTVAELGKHFSAFIKFPAPFFPSAPKEAFQRLCIHAKRLHYEKKLHLEQLIATSIRFNSAGGNEEGPSQTLKRAIAAYQFALTHQDKWSMKLSGGALKEAHIDGAAKTNARKKDTAAENKSKALELKAAGATVTKIASTLGVHRSTVSRYLK